MNRGRMSPPLRTAVDLQGCYFRTRIDGAYVTRVSAPRLLREHTRRCGFWPPMTSMYRIGWRRLPGRHEDQTRDAWLTAGFGRSGIASHCSAEAGGARFPPAP